MVKELTEKGYSSCVSRIVPVDQAKIGVHDQRYRTGCQGVGCIQNPIRSTELKKRIADGIRRRRERWQVEHATKMTVNRYIPSVREYVDWRIVHRTRRGR